MTYLDWDDDDASELVGPDDDDLTEGDSDAYDPDEMESTDYEPT